MVKRSKKLSSMFFPKSECKGFKQLSKMKGITFDTEVKVKSVQ